MKDPLNMLNEREVVGAIEVLRQLPLGLYTVKKMFGNQWSGNYRPRNYGKRFKASVMRGDVLGVRWMRKRSDKSQEYEVGLPEAV